MAKKILTDKTAKTDQSKPSDETPLVTSLEDKGYYVLMEPVTSASCREAIKFIMKANFQPKKLEYLTLVINSPGGSVDACFALVDTMKGSSIPVRTVGIGCIASCGLLLFMAGQKGHRILTPNTSILSHQWAWGLFGKEHELFAATKEFDLTTKRIIAHYKKCTGMSEKVIRKELLPPEDKWLSAEEALEYGICDKIKEVY